MDDEEFEVIEMGFASAARFRRSDIVVLGLNFLSRIAQACADSLQECTAVAGMHANWEAEQDDFHIQAAREIETLIAGEEE